MQLVKKTKLPALADSAVLRYFNFIALYFAEGLPMGMLFIGIPAWMAMNDKSIVEIGSFDVACAFPWTFKFFVAPLMDRYTYLPMGRKRPWVIICQTGLFLSMVGFAFVPDPLNNVHLLVIGGFIVSIFGASQDAATDGLAVDTVPAEEQAKTNAYMNGSRMIGSSFALTIGTWLLTDYNFKISVLVIAILIGLIIFVPLLLRERSSERIFPWSSGAPDEDNEKLQINSWAAMVRSLYMAFSLKNSFLLGLLLFTSQGAYNYFEKLLPIFAVKVSGWTNVYYSHVFSIADLTGGILGMLVGGWLIDKFGKKRMIYTYLFFIFFETLLLVFLSKYWTNVPFLYSFIIIYRWVNAFAKIGVFAIAMQCCSKKVSASQFTFYMTIGALGSMVGAALIAPVKSFFSWEVSFALFALMMLMSAFLLRLLNFNKLEQQISDMAEIDGEEKYRTTNSDAWQMSKP
ncbi:MFS transporter [Pedobacter agri]|uniref:MFS transporter n=1 Tax=Pedobacter agri TaxID=454586 RepID=UPI00292E417E|nr:MFS transporter [Pedobacter agri]